MAGVRLVGNGSAGRRLGFYHPLNFLFFLLPIRRPPRPSPSSTTSSSSFLLHPTSSSTSTTYSGHASSAHSAQHIVSALCSIVSSTTPASCGSTRRTDYRRFAIIPHKMATTTRDDDQSPWPKQTPPPSPVSDIFETSGVDGRSVKRRRLELKGVLASRQVIADQELIGACFSRHPAFRF